MAEQESKTVAIFRVVAYFNQYHKEGIRFEFVKEAWIDPSPEHRKEIDLPDHLLVVQAIDNPEVNDEMTTRFINARWIDEKKYGYEYVDFLKEELERIESLAVPLDGEYKAQVIPVINELKKLIKSNSVQGIQSNVSRRKRSKVTDFKVYLSKTGEEVLPHLVKEYHSSDFKGKNKKKYGILLVAMEMESLFKFKVLDTFSITQTEFHECMKKYFGDIGDIRGLFRNYKETKDDLNSTYEPNREQAKESVNQILEIISNAKETINSKK